MSKYIYLFIAILIVSCRADEITFIDPVFHTDTFTITVTDSFIDSIPFAVHDTTVVFCWEIDHNNDGHTAWYECPNGYIGPRF